MKGKVLRKRLKGQSMVEFAMVLPFLLLLFVGMVEVGYAMYDYIAVSNANREGVRLGARGRFTDEDIRTRIIGAGGFREGEGGAMEPLLSTAENFGMIITHIPLPRDVDTDDWQGDIEPATCCQPDCPMPVPNKINVTICASGSIADEGGDIRTISAGDSRISEISQYQTDVEVTALINEWRLAQEDTALMNEIVVVETFFAHPMLLHLPEFFPIPDPLPLYFTSSMRVTLNARTQTQ